MVEIKFSRLLELFANFGHQSVHKAWRGTLIVATFHHVIISTAANWIQTPSNMDKIH